MCLVHLSASAPGGWEEGDAITPHEEPAARTSPDTCVHVSFGWKDLKGHQVQRDLPGFENTYQNTSSVVQVSSQFPCE